MTDERRQVQSRLPTDLIDRLATRCDELGMVRNTAIQRAIEAWLGDEPIAAKPYVRPARISPIDLAEGVYDAPPIATPKPSQQQSTPKRMTIDDVRPTFTPRLKQKK